MTTTRDEYVAKLKTQLDRWNDDITRWEERARAASAQAHGQCARHLATLQAQREHARYNLQLLQDASTGAWREVARGADEAWARMREAVAQARTYFEKPPAGTTKH